MGRVLTNNVSLSYAIQTAIGTLPDPADFKLVEPDSIGQFGAEITTESRNPISRNRQAQKGAITDLDSGVEFQSDLTHDSFQDFMEGFAFASFAGAPKFAPTAVTTGGYTVTANGDLDENTLVIARGFSNAANNGLKVVGAGSTPTNIVVAGLVAEAAPPAGASVEVCGVQGTTGDIAVDADGNLTSTALDFTTLDLTVGQGMRVGGSTTATQFDSAENFGFVRIALIETNKLTLDKRPNDFVADAGTGKTIQLRYGPFLRNVSVDDADYLERIFQFELAEPNLGSGGATAYEYALDNYCNTIGINLPLTSLATMAFAFVGSDTEVPTTTQKPQNTPQLPTKRVAFGTSSDIARLRIQDVDENGINTCWKELTLTINNNVTPEKCLATLGAKYINVGQLNLTLEGQVLFEEIAIVEAIRNNTTLSMDFVLVNDDGGILFDLPSITLGNGNKNFPVNETVTVDLTATSFEDPVLGTSIGVTQFPFLD